MKGLRIINQTEWSTNDLRKLVAACLKARGANGLRNVTFAYRRAGTRRLGCAEYGGRSRMVRAGKRWVESTEGYYIRVNLPRPGTTILGIGMGPTELAKVLVTIEHEIDHTMGLRHPEMQDDAKRGCAWANGLFVRWEPKALRSADEERARKIEAHEQAIEKLRRRIARAETAISRRARSILALEAAGRRMAARSEK